MKYIVLILSLFGIDIYLKEKVENSFDKLQKKHEKSKFKTYISLEKYHNHGFAYGKLSKNKDLIKKITTGFALYIVIKFILELFSKKKSRSFNLFAYSLIIAGAFSNIRDRFKYGYVIDYFKFKKIFKKTVFNLADIYIIIASFLQIIGGIFLGK